MTLPVVSWIFAFGVALHNAEEGWLLPAWSQQAGRWHRTVGASEFRFAVTILTVLLFVCAFLSVRQGPQSVGAYLFAGYVFAMVLNAVLPHLAATIARRKYMPGLATAFLLNVPLGTYYLSQALEQDYILVSVFAWSAPLIAVLILAFIPPLFAMGRALFKQESDHQAV